MGDLGCKSCGWNSVAYRRADSPPIPLPLNQYRFRDLSIADIKQLLRERLEEERRARKASEVSAKNYAARAAEIEAMLA